MRTVRKNNNSSWDHVSGWYDGLVGSGGQYFHEHVIFPALLAQLGDIQGKRILDLACGQGVFSRLCAQMGAHVTGVDASRALIERARRYDSDNISYVVDDARTIGHLVDQQFDHVVSILAMQNIDPIAPVFSRVHDLLPVGGDFSIVILHPAFRSPRITGWGEDVQKKLQFRRIDRYMSPLKIPIDMHPGKRQGALTWTYHRPFQDYIRLASTAGFYVKDFRELVSDKQSQGAHAKSENRSRSEIPLFALFQYVRIR